MQVARQLRCVLCRSSLLLLHGSVQLAELCPRLPCILLCKLSLSQCLLFLSVLRGELPIMFVPCLYEGLAVRL